jgi:hypothetical protein
MSQISSSDATGLTTLMLFLSLDVGKKSPGETLESPSGYLATVFFCLKASASSGFHSGDVGYQCNKRAQNRILLRFLSN